MAKAVKRAQAGSWTYVLQRDKATPLEEQSGFTLRQLTGAERDALIDNLARRRTLRDGTVETMQRSRQEARELCLSCIVSIDRFPSEGPQPWPADAEAREQYLEMLDDDDVYEIGNAIYAHSTLNGERGQAVGESSPPAPTSS